MANHVEYDAPVRVLVRVHRMIDVAGLDVTPYDVARLPFSGQETDPRAVVGVPAVGKSAIGNRLRVERDGGGE